VGGYQRRKKSARLREVSTSGNKKKSERMGKKKETSMECSKRCSSLKMPHRKAKKSNSRAPPHKVNLHGTKKKLVGARSRVIKKVSVAKTEKTYDNEKNNTFRRRGRHGEKKNEPPGLCRLKKRGSRGWVKTRHS